MSFSTPTGLKSSSNRCDVRETETLRRSFRTRVRFAGYSQGCTLGSYAMPRWGKESETWCSISSNGTARIRWNAMPGSGEDTGSKTPSLNLPCRGNAYQPRVPTLGTHPREWMCSEGTPHRKGRGRYPRHAGYAAFLQNAGLFFRVDSQGLHPGLVCNAPLGHGIGNVVVDWPQRSRADTSERDARWGMDTGSKCHRPICPDGAWDWARGLHHYPGSADVLVGRCERIDSNPVARQKNVRRDDVCGVPSERRIVFPRGFSALHPGLVCDVPSAHGLGTGCSVSFVG